jgi:FKBP-type peptidyl-prolyl cis-trans isomerase
MVIRGGMKEFSVQKGRKESATITGDKAYGSQGVPDGCVIQPNATLVFDVNLYDGDKTK